MCSACQRIGNLSVKQALTITPLHKFNMKKLSAYLILLISMLLAGLAQAAPKHVEVVYQATRNGMPFATISESYKQENGHYKIESVTQGIGVYALLGKRVLKSEGEVTAEGLKPMHFELHQGDNEKKALYADFDWAANQLNMKVKGKPVSADLQVGTQDLTSLVYQFMFAQPNTDDFTLPVTTGKKLRIYNYKVSDRGAIIEVPAGKYKTLHLTDASDSEDQKELWLGVESFFLPVRLVMRDDGGAKIEQTLTSLHAE